MGKGRLIVQPMGGLANRMRVVSVLLEIAQKADVPFEVEWSQTWDFGCKWCDLFELPTELCIREMKYQNAKYAHAYRYKKWYRNINSIIWAKMHGYTWLAYNDVEVLDDCKTDEDFLRFHQYLINLLRNGETLHITTGDYLGEMHIFNIFQPIGTIKKQIDDYLANITYDKNHWYGVHIRRTDHIWSKNNSPLCAFKDKMKQILYDEPSARFYMASDDRGTMDALKTEFGEAVCTRTKTYGRDSIPGIQDAVVDMWILSKTKKIYGSYYSSFSGMASRINGIELETIKTNND